MAGSSTAYVLKICFLLKIIFVGMEAVHPPIVQDATAPLIPEKKVETGIVRERGNTDTRTGIDPAPTLTGVKGRGVASIHL